jgi:branched-chain amino acid aminotransferase
LTDSATQEWASVDGCIAPTADTTIPLKDDGLYRGDGAFEVIRLYGGRPFARTEHLDRMERSAATVELTIDRASFEPEIGALLDHYGPRDGLLRLIGTRGGRRIAATEPLPEHTPAVRLATIEYSPTLILNGVKALSYAANMQATRLAKARGADEAVLVTPDGIVLEAPTSTLFWVSPQGMLRTTALEAGVLDSITRRRLIDTIDVEEGEWPAADLAAAGEAFLASTTREVQPVSELDGRVLEDAPGPRTAEAQEAFRKVLERELGSSS